MKRKILKQKGIIFSAIFIMLYFSVIHMTRITSNDFWADECYSIINAQYDFHTMLNNTLLDVHPPLYEYMIWVMAHLFGQTAAVYHILSWIPYMIMLLMTAVIVRKRHGIGSSILLCCMLSTMAPALRNIMEVRMYEWAACFVFGAFLCFEGILLYGRRYDYIAFLIVTLLAAYTHSYALLGVAFLYLTLLIYGFLGNKKKLSKILLLCLGMFVGYLPWLFRLLKAFRSVGDGNFWITDIPSLKAAAIYIFDSKIRWILLFLYIVVIIELLWNHIKKKDKEQSYFIIGGLLAVWGVYVVAYMCSKILSPMLVLRYLYPVCPIAWFMLSIGVDSSRLNGRKLFMAFLIGLVFITGSGSLNSTIKKEKRYDASTQQIVATVSENMPEDAVLETNIVHLNWTVLSYYFPDKQIGMDSLQSMAEIPTDRKIYLFWDHKIQKDERGILKIAGFSVDKIAKGKFARKYKVWVYEVSKTDRE